MTVEELREKIGDIIYEYNMFTVEELAVQILTLVVQHYRAIGWKPREEVDKMKCCPEYEPLSDIAICNLAYRGGKPHYDEGYCGHGKCRNGTGIDWEKGE